MRHFICPNCHTRAVDDDGLEGLSGQPLGCAHCGFGYVFEILEDFFPPASAGMITCDREGRVLSCGRGVFELTGHEDEDVMGKPVVQAFGMSGFPDGQDPVALVLEWGVRKLDQHLTIRHRSGITKHVRADLFPAYDDDGGLMVSLAPEISDSTSA
jgi:PAS domain S-box-containing protein